MRQSFDLFARAAEQLVGIEPDRPSPKYAAAAAAASSSHYVRPLHRGSGSGAARSRRTPASYEAVATPVANVSYVRTPVFVEEEMDGDCFLLAKSYFDCREYRRAAHALRDQSGKKTTFLRCYALYLVCSSSSSSSRIKFLVDKMFDVLFLSIGVNPVC